VWASAHTKFKEKQMASYSSDQLVAHRTSDGQLVPATQRARITSIQAAGAASSGIKLYNGTGTGAGNVLIAEYLFGTEGLEVYVPGSGILFDAGVYLDLTATPGVTITFT
tara:strand:+ start:672 stop:1001 length:330 start_codon:yes stop_codon:yes gene_type:complete